MKYACNHHHPPAGRLLGFENETMKIKPMKHKLNNVVLLLAILTSSLSPNTPVASAAETNPATVAIESLAQRDARMAWWREARFGMFVHWGLYSGLAGTWDGKPVGKSGGMEWIQHVLK